MSKILAIARRELAGYFGSPIGWICLCTFVCISGVFFFAILMAYDSASADAVMNPMAADQLNVNEFVVQSFFGNMSVIAMLMTPALSMRLLAEDRKNRSIELLLTSPVRSIEIVLGKFLGALGFVVVLALSTAHYAGILFWLGEPDPWILFCNYLSFVLLLGTFMAVGLFASSLTENQVVALVLSFGFNLIVWIFSWMTSSAGEGPLKETIDYISMLKHVEDLGKGLVHSQDLIYFVSLMAFFVFASTQRVEAYRWR